jgi:elongation factor Ts
MIEKVKKLREASGASIADCKDALETSGGDEKKAAEILAQRGADIMEKKSSRATGAGIIEAYTHDGKIGVLVEVLCETDFVSRNPKFRAVVHDLTLQIAAMEPQDMKELLGQEFIKDQNVKVGDWFAKSVAKFGENIVIKRFIRWVLGE